MFRPRYAVIVLLLFVSTACSSTPPLDVEPSQKLIVPTATNTVIPVTPTITLTPLPRASDLSTATPAISDAGATDSVDATPEDPVAAELVALAQRRVADTTSLPVRRVEIVEVKSYKWTDVSLGCPTPDESYGQQEVDGYRIVLKANDQQFIFHTDFDRVVACDPANEKLPTALLTETPTS
jgi:hypothetical protein